VTLIDTGLPVAKHVQQVLQARQLLATSHAPSLQLLATGDTLNLQIAAKVWLDLTQPVTQV
jgi:glutamate racemase